MKTKSLLTTCCALAFGAQLAAAQGTAFTYQGRLNDGGNAANGNYDLKFSLYDALTGGSLVAVPVTNSPVAISNGAFSVRLDFGGAFTGPARFLELGTRSNGVAVTFTVLTPRQELTPTPYAITAENLDGTLAASQLTGTLPAAILSGSYGNALTVTNAANLVGGNGAGLTSLNASALASGTVNDTRLSANVALLNKNQTLTGLNIFDRGAAGPGRLIVQGNSPVDPTLFTGLGFQYHGNSGEGAIMSSYNDGFASLSFFTKAGNGFPLTKQMIIDRFGNVAVDQGNYNNGSINASATNSAGLTFGTGSGEGIASKRTGGGNQYGLDFYTAFVNRMTILNNGNVGIGTLAPAATLEVNGAVRADGVITAIGGLVIEGRTSDPASPATGRIWVRTDL